MHIASNFIILWKMVCNIVKQLIILGWIWQSSVNPVYNFPLTAKISESASQKIEKETI